MIINTNHRTKTIRRFHDGDLKNEILKYYNKNFIKDKFNILSDFEDIDLNNFLCTMISSCVSNKRSNVFFKFNKISINPKDSFILDENSLLGYHKLKNGFEFIGVEAYAFDFIPVFLIFYYDGKGFYVYVPIKGNLVNADLKTMFGFETHSEKFDKFIEGYKYYSNNLTEGYCKYHNYIDACSFLNVNKLKIDVDLILDELYYKFLKIL